MDNSPGKVVEMPRFAVEKNPNRTCAPGLHFAAWGYLQHYGYGHKTVIVKINPADVVSIPSDYNNMKGRAYKYLILKEVEQPEELKYRPVFDAPEYDEKDDADMEFFTEEGDELSDDTIDLVVVTVDVIDLDDDDTAEETYEFKALTVSQIANLEAQGYSQEELQTLDEEIFKFLGN